VQWKSSWTQSFGFKLVNRYLIERDEMCNGVLTDVSELNFA